MTSKRRLALFTDGIAPWVVGGMQMHSYLLLKYLSIEGWEVDLYHPAISGISSSSEIHGIDHELRNRINLIPIPVPESGFLPGHYLKESYAFSRSILTRFKERQQVQMIIAKGFTAWAFLEGRAKGEHVPIAVNFHGLEMFQKGITFRQRLEQWLLRGPTRYNLLNADFAFSYGGGITDILVRVGVEKAKIAEFPSGVELSSIRDQAPSVQSIRTFVFLGRWERRKGVQELNQAIRLLLKKDIHFRFHFIGPIPEQYRLQSDRIQYHGQISDREKIRSILDASDVLVCPSHSEGMPNAILEGMSAGLAVIATDTGATRIMVDDQVGTLIPTPDPMLLANTMESFVNVDEGKLYEWKLGSLRRCKEQLNWNRIGKELSRWISDRSLP